MSGNIKFRWFFIAFLLITLFCSSCAWIKSNGQWSFKKRDLKSKILKNPNDYDANYDLGVGYVKRGEKFSVPSTNWKKVSFQSAIRYLEEAIRIRPKSAEAYLALGEVLGNEKVNDGFGAIKHTVIAEKLFQSLLVEKPEDYILIANYANFKLIFIQLDNFFNFLGL